MSEEKIIVPQRIACIHDVSGIGRCALTAIMPILSVLGKQCIPLPTAFLSTHTGGFEGFTFLDMTEEMKKTVLHWQDLNIKFDGIYSGFLGSSEQIQIVSDFAAHFRKTNSNCIFLADPVMGDDGKKYKTYTDEMCMLTRELVKHADVITPNFTEACILTDEEYCDYPDENKQSRILEKLTKITRGLVVVTGLIEKTNDKKTINSIMLDEKGSFFRVSSPYINVNYPGTGDVFSSVVLSYLLDKRPLYESVKIASEFVSQCATYTKECNTACREGLCFEPLLKKLCYE